MTPEEYQLLDFANCWEPYGGPSAGDIFITFGMSRARYEQRVDEIRDRIARTRGCEAASRLPESSRG